MDIFIRKLLQRIEKEQGLSFEIFWFTDKLVIFAKRGSTIDELKIHLNEDLGEKYNHMLKNINNSIGHIVPID